MLRRHVYVVGGVLATMVAMSVVGLFVLPEQVPVHWNLHGEVTRHGSRWEALLVLPVLAAGITLLLSILPRLGPLRANLEAFKTIYGRIVIAVLGLFAAMHAMMLLMGAGAEVPVAKVVTVSIGILLAVLGNWMGKIRRNFWVGIRTPWTLANDVVWERTHRVGGRLMVLLGLLVIAAGALAPPAAAFVVLTGGAGALGFWAIGYSLWLYRRLGQVDHLKE